MEREIILAHEIKDHPNYDYTWELCDYEIEDKIKELRKEIYHLQNCRKKQPKLLVFRKLDFSKDKEREAHIFHGFQVRVKDGDKDNAILCADYWSPITHKEAEQIKKKYEISEEYLNIIKKTLNEKPNKESAE